MRQERDLVPGSPGFASSARALARRLLDEVASEARASRMPLATYRVQLHRGFTFDDAARVLPYLKALGVTDLYTSPYLKAAPGSNHGYDILDHQQLNPELGGPVAHARLVEAVRAASLGHVLDVVPNHMGIGQGNPLWMDLLENGPSASSSRFFDVDWHPLRAEMQNKVLLPVLGDHYGAVLEGGQLQLKLFNGAFEIAYFDKRFPVNPRSYPIVLALRLEELEKQIPGDPNLDELKSILTALANLPPRTEVDPVKVEERRREKEVVKRRLGALLDRSPEVRDHVLENVRLINGTPGDGRSFDVLDKLLSAQAYRLAHWRVSSEEINYRRFFDINELAAIRVEDPVVFEEAHRIPLQLVAQGVVTGLRIDHPDGLADPTAYFRALQEAHVLQRARAAGERDGVIAKEGEAGKPTWEQLEPHVRAELQRELATEGMGSPLARPLYVVAEKILGGKERLPESWAVRGTTGYDFLNQLNGIFVDKAAEKEFDRTTARFTGQHYDFRELVYDKKKLILYSSLVSEVNVLARQLAQIAEGNRWTRDFTLYSLRAALIEIVASFPVYRTYVDGTNAPDARDREYIEQAVRRAKRKNPTVNASIFDFIADVLLQRSTEHVGEDEQRRRLQFAVKLQQVLGPVMAKGLEDTTLYVYNRLVSLNEVGGEPAKFGSTVDEFHAACRERQRTYPRSLLATATHDTKRGEDTRARIDALSEVPKDWANALLAFNKANARFKTEVDGREAPDRNEEMLLYQTLLGIWPWRSAAEGDPLALPPPEELKSVRERLQQYFLKATKEAKVNTSWIQPEEKWDDAVAKFVGGVVEQPAASRFWRVFLPLARRIAHVGLHNSLSQAALKLAAPGVPDIYQGCELWDLSLVDPDNRRPVDFALRARMLAQLDQDRAARGAVATARERYLRWEDGGVKLLVTALGLRARRSHPELFGDGDYVPLRAHGSQAERLCAFARTHEGQMAVTVAPRLVNGLLTGDDRMRTLPARVFSGAVLPLPGIAAGTKFVDVFTDEQHVARAHGDGAALEVDALLGVLPVALLLKA